MVEDGTSRVIRSKRDFRIMLVTGTVSGSRPADPVFAPRAWHSSLMYTRRSEFGSNTISSIPSLCQLRFSTFIGARVITYASLMQLLILISLMEFKGKH